MKKTLSTLILVCGTLLGSASAQTSAAPFPPAVFSAKTIAIVNDTHAHEVEQGAESALQAWGQFTVSQDPENADITLRFDKTREHVGQNTEKPDADGKTADYSYSMSFSSPIHMKAYLKDSATPFYSTKTDDSKKKAGISCVNDFHTAYRAAPRPH